MIFTSAAQEQENKLVDRLLRPDTTLSNSAQGKKFVAKEFYSGDTRQTKSFWGGKSFLSKIFRTGKFARARFAIQDESNRRFP